MTGVDVGAVCAVWHMRTENRVYQAGLPRPKLGGCFQHMAERDPCEELLGALQSERDLQVALPCTGVSATATKTIFSRKLLMNLGFPPLTQWELHLTSVEASLGITPYSLKKYIYSSFFSECVQIPALSRTASLWFLQTGLCSLLFSPFCKPC